MIYIIYVLLNLLFMVVCLVLNPVVVLFANKDGHLPSWLKWFGTHDSGLDQREEFAIEKWPELVDVKPIWLRTYLRRVFWLYRNTGYGFAYYVLGYDLVPNRLKIISDSFCYDQSKNILMRGWCLHKEGYWPSSNWQYKIYLGWKFSGYEEGRHMLAMNVTPFIKHY